MATRAPTHQRPRARQHGYSRQRTREFHTGSKEWQAIRREVLARDAYECQQCGEFGKEVDHIDGDSSNNPVDGSNWQTLCGPCHAAKTAIESGIAVTLPRLPRSLIPVTLVAGPPAAGKTTYVREHAGPGDIVIDLDAIAAELRTQWLPRLLVERNQRLRALSRERTAEQCWFIVTAPRLSERRHWQATLGADRVVLEVTADECLRRVSADPERRKRPMEFWERIIHRWWRAYVKGRADEETVLYP